MSAPKGAGGGFTPGPWGVDGSHIYAPDGEIIAQVHNPGSSASDYPLEANRDLIAAAPELFEALQDCRRALEIANFSQELAVVDAALAKAGGES